LTDQTGRRAASHALDDWRPSKAWWPVTIARAEMVGEIERLASLPAPENGRRVTLLVHPSAPHPGQGLTPGVQVSLAVLKPGESTTPVRHNSTQINFCTRGGGKTLIDGRAIRFEAGCSQKSSFERQTGLAPGQGR
jgi:gentisate 1,2-dioxygenase